MKAMINQMARESHLDVYGLGLDKVKWEEALERYTELVVKGCTELIVRECLVQVNEVYTSLDNKDKRVGAAAVGLTIAAHFGVEERS